MKLTQEELFSNFKTIHFKNVILKLIQIISMVSENIADIHTYMIVIFSKSSLHIISLSNCYKKDAESIIHQKIVHS